LYITQSNIFISYYTTLLVVPSLLESAESTPIETLAAGDTVPPGFENAPTSAVHNPTQPITERDIAIELWDGRRFLKVERSVNLRARAKVSNIWRSTTASLNS
jgi:hypothetical protein